MRLTEIIKSKWFDAKIKTLIKIQNAINKNQSHYSELESLYDNLEELYYDVKKMVIYYKKLRTANLSHVIELEQSYIDTFNNYYRKLKDMFNNFYILLNKYRKLGYKGDVEDRALNLQIKFQKLLEQVKTREDQNFLREYSQAKDNYIESRNNHGFLDFEEYF